MKCFCQPPLPVVTRVSKTATNPGREFWACSKSGSGCGLFCWVGDPFPAFVKNRQSEAAKNSAKIDPSKLKVTVNFYEVILGPPASAWFAVYHPYDAQLLQFYSTIELQQQRYNESLKLRTFNFAIYDQFLRGLKSLSHVAVEELPMFLVNGVRWFLRNLPTTPISSLQLTPNMLDTLLPFQLEGVRFIVQRNGRGLIADDMGVGKTIQAIAILMHYRHKWPALVIAPPNLLIQWKKELLRFCGELLAERDISMATKGTDRPHGKVSLVPYTLLSKVCGNSDRAESFGIVIADESHNIKSRTSARAAHAIPYLHHADVAVCLSGTPSLNRPEELYIPLHCLLPKVFNSYEAFVMRYCDGKYVQPYGKLDARGASNVSELKRLLESMVMLRRLKADVGQFIPEKSREVKYVQPEGVYVQQLKGLQREARAVDKSLRECTDDAERAILTSQQQQLLNKQYMVTGLCKINAVTTLLKELVAEMHKQREAEAELALVAEAEAETAMLEDREGLPHDDEEWMRDDIVHDGRNHPSDTSSVRPTKQRSSPVVSSSICSESSTHKEIVCLLEDDLITSTVSPSNNSTDLVDSDNEINMSSDLATPQRKRLKKRKGRVSPMQSVAEDQVLSEITAVSSQRRSTRLQQTKLTRLYDDDDDAINDDMFENITSASPIETADDDIFFVDRKKKRSKLKSMSQASPSPIASKHSVSSPEAVAAWKHVLNGDSSSKPKRGRRKGEEAPTAVKSAPKPLGGKIILFAHHQEVLDALEVRLRDMDIGYMRIDGSVTMAARAVLIDKFQDDNETDVALLSITATGTGLNLTRANVALFAELVWSSGTLAQGEDRLHRLGQKSTVRIIYVLAEGSADDIVWAKLNEKQSVIGATVGTADATVHIPEKSTKGNGNKRKTPETVSNSSGSGGSQVSMDTFLRGRSAQVTKAEAAPIYMDDMNQAASAPLATIISDPKLIYGNVPNSTDSVTSSSAASGSAIGVNTVNAAHCDSSLIASTPLAPTNQPLPAATSQPPLQPPSSVPSCTPVTRPLSPTTLQRIEANRLKALAKKEAARQKALFESAVAPAAAPFNFATAGGSTLRVEGKAVSEATNRLQLNENAVQQQHITSRSIVPKSID